MFKKSFILSFLILFFVVTVAAFAVAQEPADRNCYGIFSETLSGVQWDAPSDVIDAMMYQPWQGVQDNPSRTDSPKEGNRYFKFKWTRSDWVGLGFMSKNANGYRNMSKYINGNVKFYARSLDPSTKECRVGVIFCDAKVMYPSDRTEGTVDEMKCYRTLGELGFKADGSWEELIFPLNSRDNPNITDDNPNITEDNLKKVKGFFYMAQDSSIGLVSSASIDVDYIRWVKNGAPTQINPVLDVTLKNVSDNSDVTKSTDTIAWNSGYISNPDESKNVYFVSDTFRTGWTIADRYLELNLAGFDVDLSADNIPSGDYSISVYLKNNSSERNGLYATTSSGDDIVLPMAWRANKNLIPSTTPSQNNIPSFLIKEIVLSGNAGHLQDANYSENHWSWYYFKDSSDVNTSDEKAYVKVWSYKKGLRYGEGGADMGHVTENKPKIYLALNTKDALGGLKYTGNICVVLTYE